MSSDDRTRRWGRRPVPASMAGAMAIAILAASAGAGRAAADANAALPQAARIDSLLDQAEAMGVFTGNVAITHEGALVYARSIGLADREARTPNEADTRFALGSITKLYTRILVLQLVSEGRIDPNATVGRYLDGFATAVAEHVTIQELLDHSSGLGQYYEAPGFEPSDVKSATDFLPWIRAEELRFEPGSRSEYSNSGYVVLAAIVEKVEGANYAQVLRRRIVEPLGLRSTDMMFVQGRAPKNAIGYLTSSPGPLEDNLGMHLLGGGDGGIYSTAADLLALDRSLASDTRLLPDSMKLRLINEPLLPKRYASWAEFRASGGWAIAGGAPGALEGEGGRPRDRALSLLHGVVPPHRGRVERPR